MYHMDSLKLNSNQGDISLTLHGAQETLDNLNQISKLVSEVNSKLHETNAIIEHINKNPIDIELIKGAELHLNSEQQPED